MTLKIKQLIADESGDRDYFAMVPGMLWPDTRLCAQDSEDVDVVAVHAREIGASLSVHDKWLYATLKKICDEKGGQCFMSSRGLARLAGMSIGQVSKSKAKLEKAGLITIVPRKRSARGQAIDHITVVDVWEQNVQIMRAREEGGHPPRIFRLCCPGHCFFRQVRPFRPIPSQRRKSAGFYVAKR